MTSIDMSRRTFVASAGSLTICFFLGAQEAFADVLIDQMNGAVRSVAPENLDSWLSIANDGAITLFTGRVDLGTGTQAVFAQFVAEEMDVLVSRVNVIMGDTRLTPNQGKTTASLNVVRGSQPIRVAAAEARAALLRMASERTSVPVADLEVSDGIVRSKSTPSTSISYGELIGGRNFSIILEAQAKNAEDIARGIMLKPKAPLKAMKDFRVLGKTVTRPDIPGKVAGTFEYVHNIRVPEMLHGRVVRPPTFGAKLLSVEADSIRNIPGAQVVRRNDFLGVVAPREEAAIKAALILQARWSKSETLPDFASIYDEMPKQKVIKEEFTYNKGDIPAGLDKGKTRLKAQYGFPFQDHAMIGPSCAIADVDGNRAMIWSGSQWPQGDRSDIATMLKLPLDNVHVIWHEASGSYGRLACDDAAADAAVMSQICGKPVRVQWMRDDEHGWEPVSPAMTMMLEGSCDENGHMTGFDYLQYSPSHSTGEKGNHIAWHLIGGAPGYGRMSGAAASFWYDVPAMRARNVYVEPWLRGIYLRSPGGIQSIFAYESFIEELAALAKIDPLEFRLRNTKDRRDVDVLKAVAELSDWKPETYGPKGNEPTLRGRGLAMARYGSGASRSAVVVDVEIERASGKVAITHAAIAFDCGYVLNPDGLLNQVEGGLIQGLSRGLHEEVRFDRGRVTSLNWNDYPILIVSELPEVKTRLIPRNDTAWGSAGEAGTVATAGALANAVFNATGKHPRRIPLHPAYVKTLV